MYFAAYLYILIKIILARNNFWYAFVWETFKRTPEYLHLMTTKDNTGTPLKYRNRKLLETTKKKKGTGQ